jgi:hypothetical protein
LLTWRHTTFLVGTGSKGSDVDLRLDDNGQTVAVHHLHADPHTGAFAANLGDLSRTQAVKLTRELEGRGSGGSSIVPRSLTPIRRQTTPRHSAGAPWPSVVSLLLLLAAAGVAAAYRPVRSAMRRREEAP